MPYRIAWLPGDGVGEDVMEAAQIVLDALGLNAEYLPGDIGWEYWRTEGNPLPDRTLRLLEKTDCALFAAVTSKPKEDAFIELDSSLNGKGYVYYSPIIRLRQLFNLHTNMRPCKAYLGHPLNYKEGIDLVFFRENTEGMYSGVEFNPIPQEVFEVLSRHNSTMNRFREYGLENLAFSSRVMSRQKCRNIVSKAFQYARTNNRRSVTVVDKPNVLRETGGLMLNTARAVSKEYPDIPLYETNIDAQCMWLLKNPEDYDVIVAENLFGDILSDIGAQLVGGLGFTPSANIGDDYAVFEPTHGSAPKYAGKYKVNPIAMILSVKLMLEWLGETGDAFKLEKAVADVILQGKVKTYDMGGSDSTLDMAKEVAKKI
jgi:3-isopropylmalate dehydrogenase